LLQSRDGRLYVLEVNAVPGWKALAATLRIDVAAMVLDYLKDATVLCRRRRS
jgi:ribosomal protein S6--L-glutamate ligase